MLFPNDVIRKTFQKAAGGGKENGEEKEEGHSSAEVSPICFSFIVVV